MAEYERNRSEHIWLTPVDHWAFISIMADGLRLPHETLAMTFLYVNKFVKFCRSSEAAPPLDDYSLALASLSLASKTTEAPRRLHELLLPAWRLLQSENHGFMPLTFPSATYDSLRSTLVQAELMLLRVLQFELRIPVPTKFLSRYTGRIISQINAENDRWSATEDYEGSTREYHEEYRIMDLTETCISKAAQLKVVEACKNYQLANLFPARTVAAACLYWTLKKHGLTLSRDTEGWLKEVTGDRVDVEDFKEAMIIVESL